MAYTAIDNPELYFQTKLFTGTGSALSVTLDGSEDMQPDLVWIKERSAADSAHNLTDSVRGAGKGLFSNTSAVEYDYGTGSDGTVRSFDSDGFTLGTATQVNPSSVTMVAWCWKAGAGAGSANADGSINTTSTSVSTTAGLSISTYTGDGNASATIGHGLGIKPSMIIVKPRADAGYDWNVQHGSLGATKYLYLSSTAAVATNAGMWNDTEPTTSLFTIGTYDNVNKSSSTYIAYCFAEKQGYSKFGSYTGNGNADGTFVYTGFRPAFFLFKKSSAAGNNWGIFDNKRTTFNVVNKGLKPDSNEAEYTGNDCDFLSNGVKIRATGGDIGADGITYIYMAFAEAPFVNSNGVPCNAR